METNKELPTARGAVIVKPVTYGTEPADFGICHGNGVWEIYRGETSWCVGYNIISTWEHGKVVAA